MEPSNLISNRIRKRVPFKLAPDDAEGDENECILDEQEQEDVIRELRKRDNASVRQNARLALVVLSLSFILHIIYLITPTSETPLATIMTSYPPDDAIPLATSFTLLHLLVHINLMQRFVPQRTSIKTWLRNNSFDVLAEHIPLSYTQTCALAALAPALSVISGHRLPTILWWFFAIMISVLCQSIENWDLRGEEGIKILEGLMYNVPGA